METIAFTNQTTGETLDVPIELLKDAFKPYTDGFKVGFTTAFWQTVGLTVVSAAVATGVAVGTHRFLKYRENRKAQTES